jgi:hypothetical protein
VTFIESLDEIVQFELPTPDCARRLVQNLEQARLAWVQTGDAASVVGTLLLPEAGDLAVLLRSVEAWMESESLFAIRFELDGRTYVLESPPVLVKALTW